MSDRLPTDMNLADIEEQARWEMEIEDFETAVQQKKVQLRDKKPWHVRIFPWRIEIKRRF